MSQHGYMRHMTTPPLVLEIGQKLCQYCPILTTRALLSPLFYMLVFSNVGGAKGAAPPRVLVGSPFPQTPVCLYPLLNFKHETGVMFAVV